MHSPGRQVDKTWLKHTRNTNSWKVYPLPLQRKTADPHTQGFAFLKGAGTGKPNKVLGFSCPSRDTAPPLSPPAEAIGCTPALPLGNPFSSSTEAS